MQKTSLILTFVLGFISALAICFVLLFYFKPAQMGRSVDSINLTPNPTAQVTGTPMFPDIKESDVTSLSLNTVYTGFFSKDSKCGKNYNEVFGQDDEFSSPSSPCTLDIVFNHDGSATKTIDIQRYDKKSKTKSSVEKTEWKGKISEAQFAEITRQIVATEIFQNWNDMISLTAINSRIKVASSTRARTLSSNVSEKTSDFLPLLEAFKKLDKEIKWEEVR